IPSVEAISNSIVEVIMRYLKSCALILLLLVPQLTHAQDQFADPQRKQNLSAACPEIERRFATYMERLQPPGTVVGVIIDGELAWVKAAGLREKTNNAPV